MIPHDHSRKKQHSFSKLYYSFSPFSDRKSPAPCFLNRDCGLTLLFQLLEISILYHLGRLPGIHKHCSSSCHQASHLLQAFPQHLDRPPGDSICCQEQNLLLGHLIPSFWRIQPANSPDPIPRRLSLQGHQGPPDLPLQPQ